MPFPEEIGGTRVLLVTGGNCTGKSLLRRIIHCRMKSDGCEVWQFSQQLKTAHFARVFLGDEDEESTGFITAKNMLKTLRLVDEESKDKRFIIWDEPEIGLSEESQIGLAQKLRTAFDRQRKNLIGVVFLTHSRIFVQILKDMPSLQWVSLDGYATPDAWITRKLEAVDPELLREQGFQRWRAVNKAMEAIKKGQRRKKA